MKYLPALLLPLLLTGCVLDYMPNSRPPSGLYLSNLVWSADGNHIFVMADSTTSNGNYFYMIRDYDKNGALLNSYQLPNTISFSELWPSSDDSSIFVSTSSGGNSIVYRYFLKSGTLSPIAGGQIFAESQDHLHLFVGPYTYQSQGNNFLVVDVSGAKPRLQKSWFDPSPTYVGSVWSGNKTVGYFRYNSFNLIDFVIADTTGAKLDSLDITGLSSQYSTKVFQSPGYFYFTGYNGIVKYDSSVKTNSFLSRDFIYYADIAPDGSFIVYERSSAVTSLVAINTKTGTIKEVAGNVADFPKISPSGNEVAFIDKSISSGGKLTIIPVSAP